jgi:GT2 family glycosyltransferase
MLIYADGTSKQRGHLRPADEFAQAEDVLLPSGCAALYRRAMLEQTGGFDEDFFLYVEDTDLGLRARWAGWACEYAPDAVVDHHYSHSAGAASFLKAYYVERNRLFMIVKNFPAGALLRAPCASLSRYFWHVVAIVRDRGAAARFREGGNSAWLLGLCVARAHFALLASMGTLLKKRRQIRSKAAITAAEFRSLLGCYSISAKEVAAL